MKKKLSLLLALVFVFSSGLVFAETNTKIDYLVDHKIVEGRKTSDGGTDLALDQPITRAEFSKILALTIDLKGQGDKTFPDIKNHWAKSYIESLVNDSRGIINGYLDNTFKPDNYISYHELTAMLVRAGKKNLTAEDIKKAAYPGSYIIWGGEINLFDGMDIKDFNAIENRKDAFEMLYNTLAALEEQDKLPVENGDKTEEVKKDANNKPLLKKGEVVRMAITISQKTEGDVVKQDISFKSDNKDFQIKDVELDGLTVIRIYFDEDLIGSLRYISTGTYHNQEKLTYLFDTPNGRLDIITKGLEDAINAGQTYKIDLIFQADKDIQL